jgi:hypothetical protein
MLTYYLPLFKLSLTALPSIFAAQLPFSILILLFLVLAYVDYLYERMAAIF